MPTQLPAQLPAQVTAESTAQQTASATSSSNNPSPSTSRPSNPRPSNIVWFELPVHDLPRATAFYESILATQLTVDARFPGIAIFPRSEPTATTGALAVVHEPQIEGRPSTDGAVVYLNCDGQLDRVLKRVQAAGGTILQEVAQLPGNLGFIAQVRDLDGNRIGLHAAF
jgi:predicted enzyme related to lactoylglutathione lyase